MSSGARALVALVGTLAGTAGAAGAEEPPPRRLAAAVTVIAFGEELRLSDYTERPGAVPALDADAAEIGEQFAWRGSVALLQVRFGGGPDEPFAAWVGAGPTSLTFSEESRPRSRLNPGAARRTAVAAGRTGLAGGGGTEGRLRLGARGLVSLAYDFVGGETRVENAPLFGGPALDGRCTFLAHTVACRAGLRGPGWTAWAGVRATWLDLDTRWDLAFALPPATRQVDARFGARQPVRLVLGGEWVDGPLTLRGELAIGNPAVDVAATLTISLRL